MTSSIGSWRVLSRVQDSDLVLLCRVRLESKWDHVDYRGRLGRPG